MACLGMAQVDAEGHVNVSRFGPRLAGAGGFINISQNARRVVFAGTFTAGGLEVEVEDGKLRIVKEGTQPQVREAGRADHLQRRLRGRDRPAGALRDRALRVPPHARGHGARPRWRPGIDIERDILAHMDFTPIVREPAPMDPRIFRDEPMQLDETLLGLGLAERVSYDAERNILFLNLEGLHVQAPATTSTACGAWSRSAARRSASKVALVVNYDNFLIDAAVADTYAAMVRYMETHYYTTASRYTTSAFLRLKLGEALARRRVAPHIFETPDEAHAFVAAHGSDKQGRTKWPSAPAKSPPRAKAKEKA